MITLVCGEDITSSRDKLNDLLAGKKNIVRFDGKKTTLAELDTELASDNLFASSKVIVVENFSKLKPLEKVLELLKKFESDKNIEIILWDESDISAKIKPVLKSAKISSFSFPKFYYSFLDGYTPKSSNSLKLLHEVLKTLEPEQILYGLTKRVRQLLIIRTGDYSQFQEFGRMQGWQIGKLKTQADFWTEEQLKDAFLSLGELDEKIKTSALTMPLSHHLDIILLSI